MWVTYEYHFIIIIVNIYLEHFLVVAGKLFHQQYIFG